MSTRFTVVVFFSVRRLFVLGVRWRDKAHSVIVRYDMHNNVDILWRKRICMKINMKIVDEKREEIWAKWKSHRKGVLRIFKWALGVCDIVCVASDQAIHTGFHTAFMRHLYVFLRVFHYLFHMVFATCTKPENSNRRALFFYEVERNQRLTCHWIFLEKNSHPSASFATTKHSEFLEPLEQRRR